MKYARDIVLNGQVLGAGEGPLVCLPLVGRERQDVLDEAARAAGLGPDLIEWRVDWFAEVADADAVVALASGIREAAPGIPLLFTLRTRREGGQPVALDDDGVANLCVDVCGSGLVDFVDFELSAPPEHTRRVLSAAHASGVQVVLSYHNFDETPARDVLISKIAAAQSLGGDIAKIAVMPQSLDDVLVVLGATLEASRTIEIPMISIAMGPMGVLTRLVGWYFGSSITFAADREGSAPGQMPVQTMRDILAELVRYQSDE